MASATGEDLDSHIISKSSERDSFSKRRIEQSWGYSVNVVTERGMKSVGLVYVSMAMCECCCLWAAAIDTAS